MFVMLLAVIGVGTIQNGSIANATTTVGQQLTQPEDGWTRCDDTDSKILYTNAYAVDTTPQIYKYYNNNVHVMKKNGSIKFKFYGTKLFKVFFHLSFLPRIISL